MNIFCITRDIQPNDTPTCPAAFGEGKVRDQYNEEQPAHKLRRVAGDCAEKRSRFSKDRLNEAQHLLAEGIEIKTAEVELERTKLINPTGSLRH